MNFPVFCQNCGNIFNSGIVIENCTNITFTNNTSHCPKCNYPAKLIDGTFNFINGAIEIIQAENIDKERLEKVVKKLIDLRFKSDLDGKKVGDIVKNELPELQKFSDLIPKNRADLYAFLGLIISLLSLFKSEEKSANQINISNVVNNYNFYNSSNFKSTRLISDTIKKKADSLLFNNAASSYLDNKN